MPKVRNQGRRLKAELKKDMKKTIERLGIRGQKIRKQKVEFRGGQKRY